MIRNLILTPAENVVYPLTSTFLIPVSRNLWEQTASSCCVNRFFFPCFGFEIKWIDLDELDKSFLDSGISVNNILSHIVYSTISEQCKLIFCYSCVVQIHFFTMYVQYKFIFHYSCLVESYFSLSRHDPNLYFIYPWTVNWSIVLINLSPIHA